MDILTAILIGVLSIILLYRFVPTSREDRRIAKYVDKLPGPKKYPIVGTAHNMIGVKREELFDILTDGNRKEGKLFRVWLGSTPGVVIQKPEHLEKIMATQVHVEKNVMYDSLRPWLGNGIFLNTSAYWHNTRRLMTPAFHMKMLEGFIEVFNEKAAKLVDKLEDMADGQVHDMYPLLTQSALDIICETAMNVKINAFENSDATYVDALNNYIRLLSEKVFKPWLQNKIIYRLSSQCREEEKYLKTIHDFVDSVIQKRKVFLKDEAKKDDVNNNEHDADDLGIRKRMAFLDILLQSEIDGRPLTDEEIKDNVNSIMFAGHDTSSLGTTWALILLGSNPDIQEKVREEANACFVNNELSIHDLNKMKYTEMVLKEVVRIYTPVPSIGRKLATDIELDGYLIPKGTQMIINLYEAHHDPDIWEEPEVFDPDRFLPENTKKRHPYSFVAFSAGARNCIGQKYGIAEIKVLLAHILRRFRVKCANERKDIKLYREFIIRPQDGFKVILERI